MIHKTNGFLVQLLMHRNSLCLRWDIWCETIPCTARKTDPRGQRLLLFYIFCKYLYYQIFSSSLSFSV